MVKRRYEQIPTVVSVAVCGTYSVRLELDDGIVKQVNLKRFLRGEVFLPLLDPAHFAKVSVDPVFGTIVWPNEADIAPETLYELPDEREDAA
jgi:hypothetical protein